LRAEKAAIVFEAAVRIQCAQRCKAARVKAASSRARKSRNRSRKESRLKKAKKAIAAADAYLANCKQARSFYSLRMSACEHRQADLSEHRQADRCGKALWVGAIRDVLRRTRDQQVVFSSTPKGVAGNTRLLSSSNSSAATWQANVDEWAQQQAEAKKLVEDEKRAALHLIVAATQHALTRDTADAAAECGKGIHNHNEDSGSSGFQVRFVHAVSAGCLRSLVLTPRPPLALADLRWHNHQDHHARGGAQRYHRQRED
jgi:hypothetical protein